MAYANQPTEHLIQDENDLFACKHEHKMRKSVAKQCRDDGKRWVVVMGSCKSLATDSIDWLNLYTHREMIFGKWRNRMIGIMNTHIYTPYLCRSPCTTCYLLIPHDYLHNAICNSINKHAIRFPNESIQSMQLILGIVYVAHTGTVCLHLKLIFNWIH